MTEAHARSTDPSTSHEAAASISSDKIRASQDAVLRLLLKYPGGMTDVDLVRRYGEQRDAEFPPQSPSGIRTRRHELVELEKVRDTGWKRKLPSGRSAIVWDVAP